jgi:hypothetical protein
MLGITGSDRRAAGQLQEIHLRLDVVIDHGEPIILANAGVVKANVIGYEEPMIDHVFASAFFLLAVICLYFARQTKVELDATRRELQLVSMERDGAEAKIRELADAEEAKKQLKHYQYEFIPSIVRERDKWHDLYLDAVITYGNAQNIYEKFIEQLAKAAHRPFPREVREMMAANATKAAEGKATPKMVVPDPDKTPMGPARVA